MCNVRAPRISDKVYANASHAGGQVLWRGGCWEMPRGADEQQIGNFDGYLAYVNYR